MRRAAAVVVAFVAALSVAQVPMYSDYPWGLVQNGTDQGPVYNLNCIPPLQCSSPSYGNGRIQLGDGGVLNIGVAYALDAGLADLSVSARFALDAGNIICSRCIIGDRLGLGAVGNLELGDSAVTTAKLDNLAVTEGKLGALAVTEGKLGALAVTEGKLGAAAVTNTKLADLAVSTGKLQDNAITEGKVAALAITEGKLGAGAVTNAKLGALAVDAAKLAAGAVTTAKLASGAVDAAALGTGAVTTAKLAAGAVDAAALGTGAVTTAKIASGAVTANELGTSAVTSTKLAAGAVDTTALGTSAVTEAKLASAAVTNGKMADLSVSTGKLQDLSVQTGKLDNLAVTEGKIGALAVTEGKLGALAVTEGKIGALAVTEGKIGALAVTNGKIGALAVDSGKLASAAVTSAKIAAGAVDSAAIGTNAVTATAISNLNVTASKLDDGISLQAYDEEGPAAIADRASATNASEGTYAGEGYVRFTTTGTGANLTSQVTTGLYTGTASNLLTTKAVVRYRISGGWTAGGNVTMTAVNTGDTSQTASFAISTDGNWHTAVADISGWTTAGTLRIDVNGKPNGASYNDVSYIATGNPGSGTGALISYRGSVGVGTASPGDKLSVVGGGILSSSTGNAYLVLDSGTGGAAGNQVSYIDIKNNGSLKANIAVNEAVSGTPLEINSATSGNVALATGGGNAGVGDSAPAFKLSVVGPTGPGNNSGTQRLATPGSGQGERSNLAFWATFQGTGDNGPRRAADITAGFNGGAWGNEYLALHAGNNGSSNDTYALTSEKVRIQSNGNVGIGTSGPSNKLHVLTGNVDGFRVESSNSGYLEVGKTSAQRWRWANDYNVTNALELLTGASGASPATSVMAIASDGKVALNTTSAEERLEVRTAASAYGLLHSDGTRKVGSYVDTTGGWYGTKSNNDLKLFTNNGASRLTITAGGEVRLPDYAGGGTTGASLDNNGRIIRTASDERLKEDIYDFSRPLEAVLKMRPVRFHWRDRDRFGARWDVGFIAQEMMEAVPDVVGVDSDGLYTLDYVKLIPVLAGAIQELYDDRTWLARRVQALEDRAQQAEDKLAALEARLAALEARGGP